jgi:WD40 repeat protein
VNRLRLLVGALLIGLMTALALTGFAFRESQSAQRERERTLDALKLSLSASQGLRASQAQSNNDGDLAIVLALAANEVPSPAIETQRILAEVALAPGTRRLMAGHTSFVLGVDLSPDKQFIVSASRDAKILLWNAETGALVREFERQHQGDITSVAFSPNGQYVVSTALDRYAILWDVATGAEIRRFVGHSDNTLSANFNPDGTLLATGGKDNLVIIWDVATGQEIKRFEGHTSRVPFVHFTPDGLHILSSSTEALLWKVDTLEIMQRFSLEGTAIRTTSLSNDGQQVAAGTTTGRLVIWETQTGNLVWESIEPDRLGIESLRFLPGGNELAVGISTGVIEIWDIPQNRIHYRLNGHQNIVSSLAASADGRFLVSGSVDTTVRLWNTSQASAMQTLRAHERKITGLASSPDGQRLYTTSEDGVLIAWGRADMTADPWLRSEEALIGLALSQSGALLLTANNEGQAYLLDTSTGQLLAEQVFAEGRVQSLALSPNGEWAALAFGGEPGKIILWNVNREGEILPFEFEGSQILDIDFSPDGRFLLIGGESLAQAPSLFSFELSSQSQSQIWAGADFETGFYALDISPDGSLLAAAGQNGLTYLWDFNSGQARGELRGHTDERLLDVSFSPDSRLLLSSANDKQVIIWDVAARDELQRFESSNAPQHPIFSPDGLQIWVGLNNGQLEQWQRFPLAELRAWAQENRYLRELSCGEREFYRVEPLCP